LGAAPAQEAVSGGAFVEQVAAYVEKVKLISGAANAVCKEEDVSLQP